VGRGKEGGGKEANSYRRLLPLFGAGYHRRKRTRGNLRLCNRRGEREGFGLPTLPANYG